MLPRVQKLSKLTDSVSFCCWLYDSFPAWHRGQPAAPCTRPSCQSLRRGFALLTPGISLRSRFLSAQESAVPALLFTISALTSQFHIAIFSVKIHYFHNFCTLAAVSCLCPFTFLPSDAVSFCTIIVLCTEKEKRAAKMASFVCQYLLLCVTSAEPHLLPILPLCWLHSVGLGIVFFSWAMHNMGRQILPVASRCYSNTNNKS